jgi:riboflavin kinase/FMN adenylyltransferase
MTSFLLDDPARSRFELKAWPFAAPAIAGLEHPVVAIGNFDGVHRGHRHVLGEARELANGLGRPLLALTFEPHPRTVFRPEAPVFRLTPLPQKALLLADAGADATLAVEFDRKLAGLTAEAFVDNLLLRACGASGVVVGADFRFGQGRSGDTVFLADRLAAQGAALRLATVHRHDGVVVSSSAVRAALAEGDLATAAALLGYRWWLEAQVQHGDKRGRDLGYPTANLHLPPETGLRHGIYAVRLRIDGALRTGIASFGRRPTFDNGMAKFEVFVFDFAGDLYGRTIGVEPVAFLRPEMAFDGIAPLIAQMDADSLQAREILAAH